jgi:hypothetical protein
MRHLARRFFGSLWPAGPAAADEAWVESVVLPGELVLWGRMSRADRRHAAGVARRVERAMGADATPPVLAAALLHDVGKVAAGLGTFGRVVATVAGEALNQENAAEWSKRGGIIRRVGLYLRHPQLGGDMLQLAGSDALTIAWAREHHLPAKEWTVPAEAGTALKTADDD